ncbi:MAG: ArsR/SmtB family transcription factor [Pirellulaceae bacterium]
MREVLAVMKALADENRLRILAALHDRELCLCQLVELLGLATSTVSRHASILQQAQLVKARKEGRWTLFRLDEAAPVSAGSVTACIMDALQHDRLVREDAKRLKQILKLDPEQLCRQKSAAKC